MISPNTSAIEILKATNDQMGPLYASLSLKRQGLLDVRPFFITDHFVQILRLRHIISQFHNYLQLWKREKKRLTFKMCHLDQNMPNNVKNLQPVPLFRLYIFYGIIT